MYHDCPVARGSAVYGRFDAEETAPPPEPKGLCFCEEAGLLSYQGLWLWLPNAPHNVLFHSGLCHRTNADPAVGRYVYGGIVCICGRRRFKMLCVVWYEVPVSTAMVWYRWCMYVYAVDMKL